MKKIITSKLVRQIGCVLLAVALLLPIMQLTVGFPKVLALKNSFAPYLTGVTATHPDGSAIVDPIAKDAPINVNLQFTIPSDLNSGTFSFRLPKAVTANAVAREFTVDAGVRGLATVSIPADGDCAITFAPLPEPVAPPEVVAPPTLVTPSEPAVSSEETVSSEPTESGEAPASSTPSEVTTPPELTAPTEPVIPTEPTDLATAATVVAVKSDSATAPVAPLPTIFAGGFTIATQLAPEFINEADGIAFEIGLGNVLLPIPFVAEPAMRKAMFGARGVGGSFEKNFTNVTLVCTDSSGTLIDTEHAIVPKDSYVNMTFAYAIPSGGLSVDTDYTFNIPAAVAKNAPRSISIKNGETVAAVVAIGETGACTITFKVASAVAAGETGTFEFKAQLDKDQIPNGTNELVFFSGSASPKKFPINFALDQMDGSIEIGNEGTLDAANQQVKWTVDVTPTLLNADVTASSGTASELIDFTIENIIDANLTAINSGTYVPMIVDKNNVPVSGVTFTVVGGKLICKFPSPAAWAAGDTYQLVYYTKYDLSAFENDEKNVKFTNTASASFGCHQFTANSHANSITLDATNKTIASANVADEVDVSAKLLSKTANYVGSTHKITWTVVVNEDAIAFDSALVMTDIIPAGLKLDTTSVLLNGSPVASPSYTGTGYDGGTLTVPNLTKDAKSTITYVTEINPAIWSTADSKTFTNGVSYIGTSGGNGYTFTRKFGQLCSFGGIGGGFIGASGAYSRQNHTITWTVNVNSDTAALTGGKVEITIPTGLTYVDGSLSDAMGTYADKKITVTPTDRAEKKFTFQTTVDDIAVWATNNMTGKAYGITANLTGTSGSQNINLTAKPSVTTTSEVISKTSNRYNYNTKEIGWEITFNQNQMAMDNITIEDILPAGTAYVAGSATATNATLNSATASGQKLTMKFANLAAGAAIPTVTYKTKITDESLLKPTSADSTSATFKNTATISFDQLGSTAKPTVSHSRTVGSRPLQKAGDGSSLDHPNYRNITWTVGINANQINLGTITLEDILAENLLLDLESVMLYEATVDDTSGVLTKGTKVYDGASPATTPDFVAALSGQQFTFQFKKALNKAYILEFDTDNVNPYGASYANTVTFSGVPYSSGGLQSNISQSATGSGSTNPKRSTIKLIAKDADSGAVLKGVKYTITDTKTGTKITVVTGNDGVALFTPLKFDTYTITEDLSGVPGYASMGSPATIVTSSTNKTPEQVLKYKKDGETRTLNYEVNISGVTDTQPPTTYAKGSTVTVIDNPYTTVTKNFLGWNTQSAGLGTEYQPGDSIILDEDTVLYAQWEKTAPPPNPNPPQPPNPNPNPNPIPPYYPPYYPPTYYPPTQTPTVTPKPSTPKPATPAITAPTQPAGWSTGTSLDVSAITSTPLKKGTGGLVLTAVYQNGRAIPGVKFRVHINGKDITAVTDANGVVSFPDIVPGNYPIAVVGIPEGYAFESTDAFSAVVPLEQWATGEVRVLSAAWTRVPNTGDTTPLMALLSLGLALAGITLLIGSKLMARGAHKI